MKTYGLIAHPAAHSLSPALHNAAFRALKIDAEYKLFDTPEEQLKEMIGEIKKKNYSGFSVSIPHKSKIIPYLNQVKGIALQIGAVNTIINRDGVLLGDNTDYGGFKVLLAEQGVTSVTKQTALILGAGGASLAITAALIDTGYNIIIVARDQKKAQEKMKNILLSTNGSIAFIGFDQLNSGISFNLLVNTTPIGMSPKTDECLLADPAFFQKDRLFIDIVYNPVYTKLLQLAKKHGCRVATGDRMFLWQAVGQFEMWTGQKAPVRIMEEVLQSHLK